MYCERWSNEAATVHADITADHRDVPASFFRCQCSEMTTGQAKNRRVDLIYISFHFCTVVAIWNYIRSIKED